VRLLYIANGNIPSGRTHSFRAADSARFDHAHVCPLTWRRRAAEILERLAPWMGRVA
jgi:hypothetical protein